MRPIGMLYFPAIAAGLVFQAAMAWPVAAIDVGGSQSRAVQSVICNNLVGQAIGDERRDQDVSDRQVRDVITIPLTVDLGRRMDLPVDQGIEGEFSIGTLQIDESGTVLYQGENITKSAYQLCNVLPEENKSAKSVPVKKTSQKPVPQSPEKKPRRQGNGSKGGNLIDTRSMPHGVTVNGKSEGDTVSTQGGNVPAEITAQPQNTQEGDEIDDKQPLSDYGSQAPYSGGHP